MSVTYNPSMLAKGARATFIDGIMAAPDNWVPRIATYVSSDSADEDYGWIAEPKQMEEAVSGKQLPFQPLSDATYNLANKKYWMGLSVSKDDINDDKVGGLNQRIREMALVANKKPNALLTDALTGGTTAGTMPFSATEAFFSATHAARDGEGGTQSNLLTGTGTSVAQIQADIGSAMAALLGFLGENGEPVNEGFTNVFIMYPVAVMFAFQEALQAAIISSTSNVRFEQFTFDQIPNARLDATSANDWYLGIQDVGIRGLVYQDREPVSFEAQDGNESDAAFTREEYRYKTRMRGRAGYGRWQKIVKVDNT